MLPWSWTKILSIITAVGLAIQDYESSRDWRSANCVNIIKCEVSRPSTDTQVR